MPIEEIAQQVSDRYARAARSGETMCCPTGYDMGHLKTFIPQAVLTISYGCGTPAGLKTVQPGETVVDIGSGGGIDCFEASRLVGPNGRVIGIDMTDTMLDIARAHADTVAKNLGYPTSNVDFRKGMADAMPVDDGTADLIISNCVINLAPDKRRVFHDMFRVAKAGGRFTISDIVADQPVPQYLAHDVEKWGDCLSGSLTLADYIGGLTAAGFRGVHAIVSSPWQRIDGIHFFSVTLTGYKLPVAAASTSARWATLRGPFSRVVDEDGLAFTRGVPLPITPTVGQRLSLPPFASSFLLSDAPIALDAQDARRLAIQPASEPCRWGGDFALLAGPFLEAHDDDHHHFRRGEPLEICSKTRAVLDHAGYAPHFVILNRAGEPVGSGAVTCAPTSTTGSCC